MLAIRTNMKLYWPLLILLTGYIFSISLLAANHRFIFLTETILIPLLFLTAILSRQLKEFVNDWAIYLALLLLFNAMRGLDFALIQVWHLTLHAHYVIALEKFFAFGVIVPHWLQQFFYKNHTITSSDELFAVLYGTHFVVFILLGLVLWFTRREEFWRYKIVFVLISFIGITWFLLMPTLPPWLASNHHLIPEVVPMASQIYNMKTPTIFRLMNSDPVAAMPSLHAGVATLCMLISIHHYRWRGGFVMVYTLFIYIACLVLGAHYLVDLIAGSLLAIVLYSLVYYTDWWERFRPRPFEEINNGILLFKVSLAGLILGMTLVVTTWSFSLLSQAQTLNS